MGLALSFSLEELHRFFLNASKATYATGGGLTDNVERPGFMELVYDEGDFSYRDSYTGYYKSRGMELVRYKSTPVWSSLYGGGMIHGKEQLAGNTFNILKKAFFNKSKAHFISFRGPELLEEGDWKYAYKQDGSIEEFSGYEEIKYKDETVFFHRIIGGIIIHL